MPAPKCFASRSLGATTRRGLLRVIACVGISACSGGGQRSLPLPGPETYVQFGSDPQRDAEATKRSFERNGYVETGRAQSPAFVVLSFRHPRTRRTAVRAMTAQGTALALDAPDEDTFRMRLDSSPPQTFVSVGEEVFDRDGDGNQDFEVSMLHDASTRTQEHETYTCTTLFNVTPEGRTTEVSIGALRFARIPCVARWVVRDGALRADASMIFEELRYEGRVPRVRCDFEIRRGEIRAIDQAVSTPESLSAISVAEAALSMAVRGNAEGADAELLEQMQTFERARDARAVRYLQSVRSFVFTLRSVQLEDGPDAGNPTLTDIGAVP